MHPADQRLGAAKHRRNVLDGKLRLVIDDELLFRDCRRKVVQKAFQMQLRLEETVVIHGHRLCEAVADRVQRQLRPVKTPVDVEAFV